MVWIKVMLNKNCAILHYCYICLFLLHLFVLQLLVLQKFLRLLQGDLLRTNNMNIIFTAFYNFTVQDAKCFLFFSAYIPLNNYLVFNDVDGLYTYTFEAERKVSFLFSFIKLSLTLQLSQLLFLHASGHS